MADRNAKQPTNLPGKYYVDASCSACQVCVSVAPDNFKMSDSEDHAFVHKQLNNEIMGCPGGAAHLNQLVAAAAPDGVSQGVRGERPESEF